MTRTIIGQVTRPDGWTIHADGLGVPAAVSYTPAHAYLRRQPAAPVHLAHERDWTIGTVGHLERSDRWGLVAVAVIDADLDDYLDTHGPWYWSDGLSCQRYPGSLQRGAVLMHELSIVREPASVCTRPLTVVPGDLRVGSAAVPRTIPTDWDATLWRAADRMSTARFRRATLEIFDVDPLDPAAEALTAGASPAEADLIRRRAADPTGDAGPTVRWFGQELGGELAQAVLDAIHDGDGLVGLSGRRSG